MKATEWKHIERSFFDVDEEKKVAKIVLRYEKPEDLIDDTCVSETPVLRRDALSDIGDSVAMVSSKYKVDLTLRFDDLGGYTEEQMADILDKNIALQMMSMLSAGRSRDKLAFGFIAAGVASFVLMFMIKLFWISDSMWNALFFYLLGVITDVSVFEAVTILGLERKEKQTAVWHLHKKINGIHFETRAV